MKESHLLTDTGPLVALVDTRNDNHKRCFAVLTGLLVSKVLLITTLLCLTEAMYLLYCEGGKTYAE